MFITQDQVNTVLDNHFMTCDGFFDHWHFNSSMQLILDNHHDLYDLMRDSQIDPFDIAFTAMRRFAQEACEGEYGVTEGLMTAMLVRWSLTHFDSIRVLLHNTITYITEERAEAQKVKEDITMKNTEIENIELDETTERFCAECGCVIEDGEGTEIDGEWYCDGCVEREFVECCDCGELIRKEDAWEIDGEWYCESCRDDNCEYCEICDDWHHRDNMTWIESEDRYVCDDCLERDYTRCERCGNLVRNDSVGSVIVNEGGRTEEWCDSCIEDYTWTCDECGELFSYDVDHDDDYICPNCSGGCDTGDINTWVSPRRRMNYGFKPTPCMCATQAEKDAAGPDWERKIIFYGYEEEIDRREKCYEENAWSEKIVDELTSTYCKQDCSLDKGGDYSGIEIVSHPATIAWYMEHKADFERCFDMLKEGGWLSHDAGTCGLHVHISLHPMEDQNPFAVHNMLILYDRFWDKLVKFSRRTDAQLAHWAKHYSTAHGTYENIKNMAKRECGRYMAVNLTNKHTVEIRMFRGTLNLETFFATLQLVDVITKKCIEIGNDSRKVQSITWEELIESDYEELNSYMQRRGLLPGAVELPEPPESDEPEPREFCVGDKVHCIAAPDGANSLIGHNGTVTYTERGRRLSVCVEFDNGRTWWCEAETLELVTEEDLFIPGMWVQVSDRARHNDMPDMGRIVDVIEDQIGVEFAGWHDGHNCGGHTRDNQGWYFDREFVTPVHAE